MVNFMEGDVWKYIISVDLADKSVEDRGQVIARYTSFRDAKGLIYP